MTEVSDAPVSKGAVEKNPPAVLLKKVTQTGTLEKPLTFDQIQGRVKTHLDATKRQFPQVSGEKINMIFSTFFGPFMLNREVIMNPQNERQKESKARIQHHLAHGFLHASSSEADTMYSKNIYDLARSMQFLCMESDVGRNNELGMYWSGVLNEVATIRALLDTGEYRIFLPDYTQDPAKVPMEQDEVLNWDVRSGVDLIALKGTSAILIDSKGKISDSEARGHDLDDKADVTFNGMRLDPFQMRGLNQCVAREVQKLGATEVFRARIVLPSLYVGRSRISQMPDVDYRSGIVQATSLRPDFAKQVVSKMDNLVQGASQPIAA